MNKALACLKAKRYSRLYYTFWYVREVTPGNFQPYAHSSNDTKTVATFYCGQPFNGEQV